MTDGFYVLLFLSSVFICSCTQIALKKAALKGYKGIRVYLNKSFIIGNTVFVLATLVTVVVYKYLQLSTVTLLNSASYIFVPVLEAVFLKEKIGKRTVTGIVLIISGIAICAVFG